jgi:hypothetical protein
VTPTASCLFDVVASGGRNVRLCSLEANLPASSCTVEVWTRQGTHVGHGTSPAGWQQLGGPVAVEGGGFGVPTPVPLALDLTVLAGTTRALAVLSSCGQQYTPGTGLGAVAASDLFLEVREGSEGPAWSATGSPAVWNGVLHHELPPAVSTGFSGSVPETGAMFNLRAAGGRDITIEHLDANLAAGPCIVELWTRPGSYVGFETSPAGWSLVASAAVEGAGFGTPTRLPFGANVVIPAGLTQGFHLHCDSGMQSSIGTAVGSPAAWDLFLSVEEGAGGGYFAATAAPRVWRGTVTYALDRTCMTSGYAGGAGHESAMFEVTATGGLPVNLITMAVHLEAGPTTVEIWTRPGPFAGFESTIVGWNLVGVATITGLGPGRPTPIPILLNLTVPPGQTQSIHVFASNGQRYTTGVASGGIAVADGDLAILAGNGGSYFDAVATDRVWNGTLCYTAGRCLGLCGDCDLNGVAATITDALTAAQIDVGIVLPLAAQRACCDADGSGSVAILDALRLAQVAVGLGGALACP